MNGIISDTLHHSDFQPLLLIDAEVALREINFPFIRELSKLEPFGFANEEPLFAARGLEVVGPRVVGKSHLKMRLKHNSLAIDAIGFDMSDKYDRLESSGIIDAAFVPVINEWNGGKSLQLIIKAFRPSL
jgi:single-stranded-DNA-specific exonuclease